MLCPECNHTLSSIALQTSLRSVTLDYCNSCGGIWSDQGEVNFIKPDELTPLLTVLPKNGQHRIYEFQYCPRDRTQLAPFSGESVPRDLLLFHCSKCNGIWFPENTLVNFKSAQSAKVNYFKQWNIPLHTVYAVLLPILFIAVLGIGLGISLIGVNQNTENRTSAKEMISKPMVLVSDEGVTITFTTQQAVMTKISYFTQPTIKNEIWVSSTPSLTHMVTIKNLEAKKKYSYQIELINPEKTTSPVYNFTTINK